MITKSQICHIAKLAKLNLTDSEVEKFTRELAQILDFFEQLQKIDTEKTAETSQVTGLENIIRTDEIEICENTDEIIDCSPRKIENHCPLLPKIM